MLHTALEFQIYQVNSAVLFFLLVFLTCFHSILFSWFLGVFLGLGLSGIIPTLHYVIAEGFLKAATIGQIGWLMLMASLYITGAALYAARIPERFFPGKCDIWVRVIRGDEVCAYLLVWCYQTGEWWKQKSFRLKG